MLFLFAGCLLLAYVLQQKIYERLWKKNLNIKISFMQHALYEGENGALIEEVINDKGLPLSGLEVRLGLSKNLQFQGEALENSNVSDQSYRRDIFALYAHQKIIRRLAFTCNRRGYYEITRSEIVGSDFFFHREYQDVRPQATSLYVYPRQVDVRRISLICQAISGSVVRQSRLYPDPFEFSGIREYQKTDPMHHINWKASAKSTSLMVNQFDSTTSVDLTILLDTQDQGILRHEKLTEEGIRIAASLAAQMQRRQMDLVVAGNGIVCMEQKEEPLYLFLKAGAGKMTELNKRLACLDLKKEGLDLNDLLRETAKEGKSEQVYVLISGNTRDMDPTLLSFAARKRNAVIWVIPYQRGSMFQVPAIHGVQVIGWEVQ